ncbi:hypothetical protein [Streptomyces sp. NBC_00134]|uniref:hypothetical protein n=1 Tax=Streptomyces sp. NBC_00134 TaxID=2975663 RepID=UPI00324E5607
MSRRRLLQRDTSRHTPGWRPAPKAIDDDMLAFAQALKAKGTPVPDITKKLTIKTGKNAGQHPSVASLYRALAEADD